jgi:hypothetical protein
MTFVVVVDREDGVVAWVIVVASVVLISTALVLWHPCTMDSGRHNFLSASNANFSWHGFLTAGLPSEHSM